MVLKAYNTIYALGVKNSIYSCELNFLLLPFKVRDLQLELEQISADFEN